MPACPFRGLVEFRLLWHWEQGPVLPRPNRHPAGACPAIDEDSDAPPGSSSPVQPQLRSLPEECDTGGQTSKWKVCRYALHASLEPATGLLDGHSSGA